MYMDKGLKEDELYQIKDQFNERKITLVKFYSIPLNEIHSLYDGIGRTCSILFANDDKARKLIDRTKKQNTNIKNYFRCIQCSVFTKNTNIKVLCFLQLLKNTKYVRIALNHF